MAPVPSSSKQAKLTEDAPKTRGRRAIQYRGLFAKDLPSMMYGFGDAREPDAQSIEVMEALTINFLTDLCHRCRPAPYSFPASRGYAYSNRAKVKIDDIRFALRKDEKKLARLEELLYLEGIINGAKKILSTDVVDDVARQVEAEEKEKGGGGGGSGPAASTNAAERSAREDAGEQEQAGGDDEL
ncbi:unnamed protein product [Sympodiomycopsis kandeliae]